MPEQSNSTPEYENPSSRPDLVRLMGADALLAIFTGNLQIYLGTPNEEGPVENIPTDDAPFPYRA